MDSATDTTGLALLCCGLIGTLVTDDGLVERSFAEAIATQGVVSGTSAFARRMSQVHQARGRSPGDVLRVLFPDNEARAQAAQLAFDLALPEALSRGRIEPIDGAMDALDHIRASGLRVCVLTSLPRRVLDQVLKAADLHPHIDLALSREDAPRGFPAPDLVLTAVLQTGVAAVHDVAVVNTTGAAMECGRRAGASVVVGVLTGPHSAARLRAAGATRVVSGIADLPALLRKLQPSSAAAAGGVSNGAASQSSHHERGARAAVTPVDVPAQVGERRLGG